MEVNEQTKNLSEKLPVRGGGMEGGAGASLWESGDENQRYLTWALLVLGLVVFYVLGRFFQFGLDWVLDRMFLDSSLALTLERLPGQLKPGFLLAAGVAFALGMHARKNPKINNYGLEVVAELRKVTWSPFDMIWKSTIAVIVTVFICAAILGFFDFIWGGFSNFLLR